MDRKQIDNGLKLDSKCIENRQKFGKTKQKLDKKLDRNQIKNGQKLDRKWIEIKQKMDRNQIEN